MTGGRRAPALALGALVAVVLAGAAVPGPRGAAEQPTGTQQPVTATSLVCPQPSDVPQSVAGADAVALPGVQAPAGAGTLALSQLLAADTTGEPVAQTESRGETVSAATTDASVLAAAAGSLAPATTAQVTTTAAGDRTSGLASVVCTEPAREWWFVAGSGEVGRRASLVLGNAASGPAVVDVDIWTQDGPLAASGTRDLGVPARGTRVVPIDAAAGGAERLAVRVRASSGKVGAALVLREVDGVDPVGLSWVGPSVSPATQAFVPALPAADERSLRLLNPGEQDAIVAVRALGATGPYTPLGLEALDVPAGTVVDVDLAPVGAEVAALEVTSNRPVVAAATAARTTDLRDLAVLGTTPATSDPAAARVSSADGRTSRLLVTALPAPEQASTESPPSVSPSPSPSPSPSSSPAPSPSRSASPTPAASPATTAQASPSPTATATPSPAEPRDVVVMVRLLGLDGTALGSDQRVRVRPGQTVVVPVTLPTDVTDGWVVATAPDAPVLLTRETDATVAVPDPLDPEATRDATWFDLLALTGSRTTVTVPPVAPDVTVGLPGQSSPE